ncbi:MAG: branched-chain amino acid ABC transporter permease [Bacillota bacterium]|nr:branched-chain amino acid ABC transporter permease [Bacillota bacterium]
MSTFLQAMTNGVLIGGVYALVAVGLTLIFGVMNTVNFAQGEFLMLGMFTTLMLAETARVDPYVFLVLVAVAFFVFGFLLEKYLIHRTIDRGHETQILLTLGLSVLFKSLALVIWGPNFRSAVVSYRLKSLYVGGVLISYPRLLSFGVAVVVMLALWFFLNRTELGRAMRASAVNRKSAALMGINPDLMYGLAFGIGIMLAAVGGVSLVPFYYVFPDVGAFFGTIAFVVVVLGGLGDILGAVVGALLIGVVEALTAQYVALDLSHLGVFLAFILVLLFRPQGLIRGKGWA